MRLAVVDGALVPAEDAPAAALNVLELVALALVSAGDYHGSDIGDEIPQATWDRLHELELVYTGRDWCGDGYTAITARGEAELVALVEQAARP